MPRVGWVFDDGDEQYTWEVNPLEADSPQLQKTINFQVSTAPNGASLVFEGRPQQPTISVSGDILSQSQLETLTEWFNKRKLISLTDDLEREFQVYITSFLPRRVRSISHPWRHNYTMDMLVVSGP